MISPVLGRVNIYNRNFKSHSCHLSALHWIETLLLCSQKTPVALKIIKEESRQVPLHCKRGYGSLPITAPIIFDILSTLSFPPVLQNSSCHNRAHLLSLHGGRWWGQRKHLLGIFSFLGYEAEMSQCLTRQSGVTPSGESLPCSVHSQLIPREWLSPKDFFIPLTEKKITTELTSPVKIHDSGKSSRIKWGVGGNIS